MGRQIFFSCTSPQPRLHPHLSVHCSRAHQSHRCIKYKLNIHSHTIPLCPSRTTKTRCLVVSVGALLPLPFDLAMSTPSHYPTLSLTNNQDSLSGCFGGSIVVPPFRLGDIHLVSVRRPPLVKLPSLPGHGLKAGGLGAVLHTFPSAVAL